jgi:hypothetical protein
MQTPGLAVTATAGPSEPLSYPSSPPHFIAMATGVEIAGLVLGTFPVAVQVLAAYANGCQKISGKCFVFARSFRFVLRATTDMYHYSQLLKEFSIEMDTEHVKFLNTCENILQDVVSPSELLELLKPGSERWNSPELTRGTQKTTSRTLG